jgi:hypothetical protein
MASIVHGGLPVTMKALIFDPNARSGLRFGNVAEPDPTAAQALLEVHAISLNFGELAGDLGCDSASTDRPCCILGVLDQNQPKPTKLHSTPCTFPPPPRHAKLVRLLPRGHEMNLLPR